MLAFRIIATILIGISVITGLFKNAAMLYDKNEKYDDTSLKIIIGASIWSIIWRAFVIVAIWIV